MSGALEATCRLAWNTFRGSVSDKSGLLQKVLKLKDSVAALRIADIGIRESQIHSLTPQSDNEIDAPVGYVEVFEDDILTVGAFLLKEHASLPLHNHPTMYGCLKVIHGQIKVQAFDLLEKSRDEETPDFATHFPPRSEDLWKLRSKPEANFTPDSEPILTTPTEGNLHRIVAVGGPAIFVDFISPPYNISLGRDCYYFKELDVTNEHKGYADDIVWAKRIECPSSYYCEQLQYYGPDVDVTEQR